MRLQVAPDKGWAWVIALVACLINMIMSGLSRMIGLLYVEVINTFGVSRQDATLPFSVRNSIRCVAGPLVGLVGQKYAIRWVTFWGVMATAVGSGLCAIAPDVFWLTLFWGVITGFGSAFGRTLFLLVVTQYFEKHKTTACGIAMSGGCFGSLLLPFIFEAIMSEYNLHGAFLMLGGIILQILPLTILLNSPPWVINNKQQTEKSRVNTDTDDGMTNHNSANLTEGEEDQVSVRSLCATSFTGDIMDNVPTICAKMTCSNAAQDSNSTDKQSVNDENNTKHLKCLTVNGDSENQISNQNNQVFDKASSIQLGTSSVLEMENDKKSRKEKKGFANVISSSFLKIVRLYRYPMFIVLNICLAAYATILILVSTVIVDYGQDKGLSENDGKFLIIANAIGDLFGRLCFGWVTDKRFLTAQKYIMMAFVMQGVCVSAFPSAHSFAIFIIFLFLYGMVSGSALVLFPRLVFQYVSVDEQPLAMACSNFLAGIVSFFIPPFIGYFRDNVGSYDGAFYICGGISVLSGLLWLAEPTLVKCNVSRPAKFCTKSRK